MKSVCFTGHRNTPCNNAELNSTLKSVIISCIMSGTSDFYSGGASGFDTAAARTVLELKKTYPVRLHLILPCPNNEQTLKMTADEKAEFMHILALADSIEYTSEHCRKDSMKKRNLRLVEYADTCICFLNEKRKRSGTSQTVNFARKKGIEIINIYTAQKTAYPQ